MSSTGKNRFVCRVVRFQIALSSKAETNNGHVANCPDCQAFYRANNALEGALRHDAVRETQPAPDDLSARIARSVRQSAPAPRQSRRRVTWFAYAGTAAAAALLAVFIVRQHSPIPSTIANNQPNPEIRAGDVVELVANVDKLRIQLLNSVEPTAEKIATQNPLTQELNSVQADARSALGFLALNFLPTDSAHQLETTVESTRS